VRQTWSNEEVLAAFEDYLQVTLVVGNADVHRLREDALATVREFVRAIDPVPLSEALVKEMKFFERHGKRSHGRAIGMAYFREFRDSVLKSKRHKR
jgi:hypothetical protein